LKCLPNLGILTQGRSRRHGFAVLHVVLKPGTHDDFAKSLTTDSRVQAGYDVGAGFFTPSRPASSISCARSA